MKPFSLLLGLSLLAAAPAFGAEVPNRPSMNVKVPDYALSSKSFTFPSGLRVIMQADASQPVVGVTSYYDRGSSDDPVGKEGIAHFVEHLWFRSEHGDLPKIWNVLSDLGSYLNASTADDWTNYMTVAPATSIEHLIRLESLRLVDAVAEVTEETVDIEREVIRNELRMRKENGFMGAMPYMIEKLYPSDHPYARGGIGSHESLNNIKLVDIQKFVEDHYIPENTTIAIVGDFDADKSASLLFSNLHPQVIHPDLTEEHIKKFIAPDFEGDNPDPDNADHWIIWAEDPNKPGVPLELSQPKVRIDRGAPAKQPPEPVDRKISYHKAPVDYRTVALAWTLPGAYRGNEALMNVAANMAGGQMAQYFWDDTNVRGSKGNKEVGCFAWPSEHDSKVICMVTLRSTKVDGERYAVKALDQLAPIWNPELRQLMDMSFSRAKQQGLASVLQSIDTVASLSGRATSLAQHAHYTGSAQQASDTMNDIMKINATDVIDIAYKYMQRDRAVMVVLDPIPEEERVLDSSDAEYHGATKDSDILISATDPNAITPEVVEQTIVTPDLDKLKEKTLDNGLRIVVMPHGEAPIADMRVIFHGGSASSASQPGLDDFVETFSSSLWNEASPAYDPLQLAGNWQFSGGDNYSAEGLRVSSGNVDGGLWLLRTALEQRRPDIGGKPGWIKRRKSAILSNWGDEDWWASQTWRDHLNPDHRLFKWLTQPEYDAMKDWSNSTITGYFDTKFRPDNATLLIVGAVEPDETLEMAEKYFSGWKKPGKELPDLAKVDPPNKPKDGIKTYVFDDPKNTQTNVQMICRIADTSAETEAARQVLGDVLSERAWQILREQSGVTYGASAQTFAFTGGSSFLVLSSLVQNDSSVLAHKTFSTLVEETQRGEFDEDRVKLIKHNRAKKYVLGQQSAAGMASRLEGFIADKRPWTDFDAYAKSLGALKGEDMKNVVGDCKNHMVYTIVGPKSVIEESMKEGGIDYEILDWDAAGDALYEKYDPKGFKKYMKDKAKSEKKKAKDEAKEKAKKGGDDSSGDDDDLSDETSTDAD